jgi:hypothetical protein
MIIHHSFIDYRKIIMSLLALSQVIKNNYSAVIMNLEKGAFLTSGKVI